MMFMSSLLQGVWTTLTITFGAFAVGCIGGIPLALLRRSPNTVVAGVGMAIIEFLRSIPPLVWLFIAFYAIGTDFVTLSPIQAAVAGLGLIASAYMAEIYRAAIDSVPPGQWEAAGALGLKTQTVYSHVISPQALVLLVPPAATYAIGLLKDSAVASVVTATDITFYAFQESRQTTSGFAVFIAAAALYLILSLPIAAVARLGGRLIEHRITA